MACGTQLVHRGGGVIVREDATCLEYECKGTEGRTVNINADTDAVADAKKCPLDLDTCNDAWCCKPPEQGKCSEFTGCGDDQIVLDNEVCASDQASCDAATCCAPQGVCSDFDCGEGVPLSEGSCPGDQLSCTYEECCEDVGVCNAEDALSFCPESKPVLKKDIECPAGQGSCDSSLCCEALQTCDDVACDKDNEYEINVGTACPDNKCNDDFCCALKPCAGMPQGCVPKTCEDFRCEGKLEFLMPKAAQIECAASSDDSCAPEDCCEPAGDCAEFDCGNVRVKTDDKCEGPQSTCNAEKCCSIAVQGVASEPTSPCQSKGEERLAALHYLKHWHYQQMLFPEEHTYADDKSFEPRHRCHAHPGTCKGVCDCKYGTSGRDCNQQVDGLPICTKEMMASCPATDVVVKPRARSECMSQCLLITNDVMAMLNEPPAGKGASEQKGDYMTAMSNVLTDLNEMPDKCAEVVGGETELLDHYAGLFIKKYDHVGCTSGTTPAAKLAMHPLDPGFLTSTAKVRASE